MEVGSDELQAVAAPDAPPAQPALDSADGTAPFSYVPEIAYTTDVDGHTVPLDVYAPTGVVSAPVVILAPGALADSDSATTSTTSRVPSPSVAPSS
jgi:hypothetical protein